MKAIIANIISGTPILTESAIMEAMTTPKGGQFVTVEWVAPCKLRKADANRLFTHTKVTALIGASYEHRASVIEAYKNGYNPDETISNAVKSAYIEVVPNRIYRGAKNPTQLYISVQVMKTLAHEVMNADGVKVTDEEIRNMGLGYYLDQKANRKAYHAQADKPDDHTRKVKFERIIAIG